MQQAMDIVWTMGFIEGLTLGVFIACIIWIKYKT